MADRRMFSKRLTNSAKFIKMPPSTQNLYFHLGLNADDDGVVEAYSIIKQINATEDDLKVLVAKEFVKVLNEDLVTYIVDWRENNKLRADRKIDSIYKDLLLQVLPQTKLLEAKVRADRKKEDENIGTSHGQPKDGIGQDRIGKDNDRKIDNKIINIINSADFENLKLVEEATQEYDEALKEKELFIEREYISLLSPEDYKKYALMQNAIIYLLQEKNELYNQINNLILFKTYNNFLIAKQNETIINNLRYFVVALENEVIKQKR